MKTISKIRRKIFLDDKQIVHIIGNILMVIGAIIVFIYQTKRTYSFYWLGLGLALLGSVYYVWKYSNEGRTQIRSTDKNWNTKISGKAQNKIMFVFIGGILLVIGVIILEFRFTDLSKTIGAVIYSLIVMVIYQLLMFYFTNSLYKEIIKTEKSIINSQLKK